MSNGYPCRRLGGDFCRLGTPHLVFCDFLLRGNAEIVDELLARADCGLLFRCIDNDLLRGNCIIAEDDATVQSQHNVKFSRYLSKSLTGVIRKIYIKRDCFMALRRFIPYALHFNRLFQKRPLCLWELRENTLLHEGHRTFRIQAAPVFRVLE